MSRPFYAAMATGAIVAGIFATIKQVMAIRAEGKVRIAEIERQTASTVAAIKAGTAAMTVQHHKDSHARTVMAIDLTASLWLDGEMTEEVSALIQAARAANDQYLATGDEAFHKEASALHTQASDLSMSYYTERVRAGRGLGNLGGAKRRPIIMPKL